MNFLFDLSCKAESLLVLNANSNNKFSAGYGT